MPNWGKMFALGGLRAAEKGAAGHTKAKKARLDRDYAAEKLKQGSKTAAQKNYEYSFTPEEQATHDSKKTKQHLVDFSRSESREPVPTPKKSTYDARYKHYKNQGKPEAEARQLAHNDVYPNKTTSLLGTGGGNEDVDIVKHKKK